MTEIIHHFRPAGTWLPFSNQSWSNKGGFAVMATHVPGDSFVTIATAKCSSEDMYVKKVACSMLRADFASGKTVVLPLANKRRWDLTHRELRDYIIELFSDTIKQFE